MIRRLLHRARHRSFGLWALIAPPAIWALHFLFCYVYGAVHCAKGGPSQPLDDVRIAVALATLLSLGLVAAIFAIALAQTRLEGDPAPYDDSTREDRRRFVATAKLLLAGLSFVAIVYTAIPAFFFANCR